MQPISIGRVVLYKLTESDAASINKRRADFDSSAQWPGGAVRHIGNSVSAGDVFPVIVTKAWTESTFNGQVLLDGNDTLWVTSVVPGTENGQWSWPPRV